MPTVTAEELTRRIQSLGGDTSKTFITDDDCYDWIMDAQHQISKITECLTSTYNISTVADQEYYDTLGTIIKYLRVTYDSAKLTQTSIETLDQIDPDRDRGSGGTPTHYFSDGDQIGLWPRPSVSLTNGIRIRARILATDPITSGSDVIQIPDLFREDIVRYCMLKMREKDEQPETLAIFFQDWQNKLGVSKDIINYMEGSSYPSVVDMESIYDAWDMGYLL